MIKMGVSRFLVKMIPAINGCTTQGNGLPALASDAVQQIEDDSLAIYDDSPIAGKSILK